MTTIEMIRNLRAISDRYKTDRLSFGQLDISQMCSDVAERLSDLEKYEKIVSKGMLKAFDQMYLEKCQEVNRLNRRIKEIQMKAADKTIAAMKPKIEHGNYLDTYYCPRCRTGLICRDGSGWFCGRKTKFCPECGQEIEWGNKE